MYIAGHYIFMSRGVNLLHISDTIYTVEHKELVRVASLWLDTAFKMWAGYRAI